MKILLPFSGGLDSTYLLHKAIKDGHYVEAIYVTLENNECKAKREIAACYKILDYYKKEYGVNVHFNIRNKFMLDFGEGLELKQPIAWLTALAYSVDTSFGEVQLGYCIGDHANSYRQEILNIWEAYRGLAGGELPPLTFPIIKELKSQYAQKLPNRVFQMTTFCESNNEEDTDCGECHSCRRAMYEETFLMYDRNNTDGQLSKKNMNECATVEHKLKVTPSIDFNQLSLFDPEFVLKDELEVVAEDKILQKLSSAKLNMTS
jgi:7-cyano-7-deazaguanine synthase in queuosine biosynthesis